MLSALSQLLPGAPQYICEETSDRPHIKIVRFENTGHLIHREQFDGFIAVVIAFLTEHSSHE